MRTDSEIKRDVESELKWDPELDATDIAVSVTGGVVALSGYARRYFDKYIAERVAKRVAGVHGVADDIEVRVPSSDKVADPEIARDAVAAIRAQLPGVADKIQVIVNEGWVILEGELEWNFERARAEAAVRHLKGVKSVRNQIHVKPRVVPAEVKRKIEEAFRRNAEVDAQHITVEASGGELVLKGSVRTWAERQEAQRVAWSAPGVTKVDNQITVGS
jgi:osmotically-inducible protein OsmY